MSRDFAGTLVMDFFVAFGVIIGGSLIGGMGALMIGRPPLSTIHDLASGLKIWALVAAIGGTFDAITSLERGLFAGTHADMYKTIAMICAALGGANTGTLIIQWITQEQITS
ncbi:YtrH family sporulation protein [Salibacterium halotolerans]|uniref:Sporulation protein YtrH n=1 Tax=Salibacterium halotolerans TaxID=1884432 RepID=A0A1I5VGU6_9BACI|nr:YtrH family sporulation protein [Salibacterium halotolerans]SFQ06778.1 Sporulation protein YtrH [Salibacterium halotolerans]